MGLATPTQVSGTRLHSGGGGGGGGVCTCMCVCVCVCVPFTLSEKCFCGFWPDLTFMASKADKSVVDYY